MKRIFLTLFYVSYLAIIPVYAQARLGDFAMQGAATQEMSADGFVAAHSSLPLESKVFITNPANNREVEVTIVARIPPSRNRIVDLSHSAAQALGLSPGENVIITVAPPPRPTVEPAERRQVIVDLAEQPGTTNIQAAQAQQPLPAAVTPAPAPSLAVVPREEIISGRTELIPSGQESSSQNIIVNNIETGGSGSDDRPLQQPFSIVINNYNHVFPNNPPGAETEQSVPAVQPAQSVQTQPVQPFTPAPVTQPPILSHTPAPVTQPPILSHTPAPVTQPPVIPHAPPPVTQQPVISHTPPPAAQPENGRLQTPAPVHSELIQVLPPPVMPENLLIIPGLPDRTCVKIYRLQIGTFTGLDSATRIARLIQTVGFEAELEFTGTAYRVLAVGIPSIDVYPASLRLGALGFNQIWVRE